MAARIHPTAEVSPQAVVGEGTSIWHWAQVREGARIGARCNIGKDVYIDTNVTVGDDCKIQNFATLYHGLTVGNRVFIGPHACFTNDLYPRAVSPDWQVVPTKVEDGASIGANATVLCGVTIGRNAMVAAGPSSQRLSPPTPSSPACPRRSSAGSASAGGHWTGPCVAPTMAGRSRNSSPGRPSYAGVRPAGGREERTFILPTRVAPRG